MTRKWLLSCAAAALTLTLASATTGQAARHLFAITGTAQFAPGHLASWPGGARFFAPGHRQT
jgi:hypothetical protein